MHNLADLFQASKRFFASLEGHGDTKNLLPISQFLSGGIGGMISQYGSLCHSYFLIPAQNKCH